MHRRYIATASVMLVLMQGPAAAGLLLDRGGGPLGTHAADTPPLAAGPAPEPAPAVAPPPVLAQPDAPEVRAREAEPPLTRAMVEERLRDLPCAVLSVTERAGRIAITGTVAGAKAEAHLEQALVGLSPPDAPEGAPIHEVDIAPDALCEPLRLLKRPLAANAPATGDGLEVLPAGGSTDLAMGAPLVLDIRGPAFAGHLRVDYYTVDGMVVHLLPNPLEPEARTAAGRSRRLGERSAGGRFWTIGPPFGTELLTVLASREPLLPQPRPEAEPAAAYLADLGRALDSAAAPMAAAALFIRTGVRGASP